MALTRTVPMSRQFASSFAHLPLELSYCSTLRMNGSRSTFNQMSTILTFDESNNIMRRTMQIRPITITRLALGDKVQPSQKICVWEETVSASLAKSSLDSNRDEEKRPNRAATYYQSTEAGWQVVSTANDRSSYVSSLTSKLASIKNIDISNIQSIPFIHHFLPANYPYSVCSSYTTYASYCFAGSIAGSAAMVLSTQALLLAVGVGNSAAAPMAAALNWVMKDGVGQLGGVIFASQLGKGGIDVGYWKSRVAKLTGETKRSKGNFQTGTADSNPKRWRMVAAIALDASTLMEICTPMLGPQWFLPCASVANIGKNVGFLAASASRAAIHQNLCLGGGFSQSKPVGDDGGKELASKTDCGTKKEETTNALSFNNNLGDVTAKSGSQAIVASLLGTTLGILLSQTFCSDHGTTGILAGFIVLSAVHQVCTYRALRAVPLKSLDRHRLHICLNDYIAKNRETIFQSKQISSYQSKVLTPMQVSDRDSFLPLMHPDDSVNWLSIGAPLLELCPSGAGELQSLLIPLSETNKDISLDNCERYIMKVDPGDRTVLLTYLDGATENDILKGVFHAYVARDILLSEDFEKFEEMNRHTIKTAHIITNEHLPVFAEHLLSSGWEIRSGYVSVECGSSHRLGVELELN